MKPALRLFLLCLPFGLLGAGVASANQASQSIYRGLHPSDISIADAVIQDALESTLSGRMQTWLNQATGHSGSVRPVRTFRIADGRYCREFRLFVTSDHGRAATKRTACRDHGGGWREVGDTGRR